MPSIDVDFLRQLRVDFKSYMCFLETGTYLGGTIFAMEPWFDHLYTIEISEAYHLHTKSRYVGHKIRFLLGDSSQVLPSLLPEIPGKCIFFLDGHWSAEDTGRGVKDCPLMEELAAICRYFTHEAVVIIDDCRLFGRGPSQSGSRCELCDWEDICAESLLSVVRSRVSDTYYLDSSCAPNDRLVVHLCACV